METRQLLSDAASVARGGPLGSRGDRRDAENAESRNYRRVPERSRYCAGGDQPPFLLPRPTPRRRTIRRS